MTKPSKDPAAKAKAGRNWLLALALFAFVALVFTITLVRLGGQVGHF